MKIKRKEAVNGQVKKYPFGRPIVNQQEPS